MVESRRSTRSIIRIRMAFIDPPGSKAGLNTLVGQNAAANQRNFRTGYMQQWNFDIQQELGRGTVLEVLYAGSAGVGLPAQWASQLNQLDDSYLSSRRCAPRAGRAIRFLASCKQDRWRSQLWPGGNCCVRSRSSRRCMPKACRLGHSTYHSFQLQFNRRLGSSVISAAYTLSKAIGNTESRSDWLEGGAQGTSMGFLNNNNRRLDRSLAVADVPHRLVVSYSLDLPFGKGSRFLKDLGPADLLVSGWQFSGVYTAQSGTPIAVGTPTNLTGALQRRDRRVRIVQQQLPAE